MKLVAVGGGSGGHVTPVLAVIDELYRIDPALTVRFVCDKGFETQSRGLMKGAAVDVNVTTIAAGKFRRYAHLSIFQHITTPAIIVKNCIDIFRIGIGFFQSLSLLLRDRPDVVFAKGGYVCLPMGLAARLLKIPLVIHDSDTRPGLTNRILARFATKIATGSPLEHYKYDSSKSSYIGVPIGKNFKPVTAEQQRKLKGLLGLSSSTPLVVATGGGLGATSINHALVKAAHSLAARGVAVYHITGKSHYDEIAPLVKDIKLYTAVPFVYENMQNVLGAADVVITRASATFLQELAGLAKPVIAVPARQLGDQLKNAAMYGEAGAALILTDDEINTGSALEADIVRLLANKDLASSLGKTLHNFARPNAAKDLAKLIQGAVKKA